jgi:hypothetical protein
MEDMELYFLDKIDIDQKLEVKCGELIDAPKNTELKEILRCFPKAKDGFGLKLLNGK